MDEEYPPHPAEKSCYVGEWLPSNHIRTLLLIVSVRLMSDDATDHTTRGKACYSDHCHYRILGGVGCIDLLCWMDYLCEQCTD